MQVYRNRKVEGSGLSDQGELKLWDGKNPPSALRTLFNPIKEELIHLEGLRREWQEYIPTYYFETKVQRIRTQYKRGQEELFSIKESLVQPEPEPVDFTQGFEAIFGQKRNSVGITPPDWTDSATSRFPSVDMMIAKQKQQYLSDGQLDPVAIIEATSFRTEDQRLERWADQHTLLRLMAEATFTSDQKPMFQHLYEVDFGDLNYIWPRSISAYSVGKPSEDSRPKQEAKPQTPGEQKKAAEEPPSQPTRQFGWDLSGYRLLQGQKPLANRGLQEAYVFWHNCLYLSGTTTVLKGEVEFLPTLEGPEGQLLVERVSTLTQFVIARKHSLDFTLKVGDAKNAPKPSKSQKVDEDVAMSQLGALDAQWAMGELTDTELAEAKEKVAKGIYGTETPMDTDPKDVFDMKDLLALIEQGEGDQIFGLVGKKPVNIDPVVLYLYKFLHGLVHLYLPEYQTGDMDAFKASLMGKLKNLKPKKVLQGTELVTALTQRIPALIGRKDPYDYAGTTQGQQTAVTFAFAGMIELGQRADSNKSRATIDETVEVLAEVLVAGVRGRKTTVPKPWEAHAKKDPQNKDLQAKAQVIPTQQDGTIIDPTIRRVYNTVPVMCPRITTHLYARRYSNIKPKSFWLHESNPMRDFFNASGGFGMPQAKPPKYATTTDARGKEIKVELDSNSCYGIEFPLTRRYNPERRNPALTEMIDQRIYKILRDETQPLDTPIFETSNVCHRGFVSLTAEVDYDIFPQIRPRRRNNADQLAAMTKGKVKTQKATRLSFSITIDGSTRDYVLPMMSEGLIHQMCLHDVQGKYNMPAYVERDLTRTSYSHVRVLLTRSAADGSAHPFGVVFTPSVEVCSQVAENLVQHFSVGSLYPWQPEVGVAVKAFNFTFPEVLHQLPPAMYEYIVCHSGPCTMVSTWDLQAFCEDPNSYWIRTSMCMGYVGSFTKGEMLYGITIDRIALTPRLLLRYMDTKITTSLYFYDYRSNGLISPWASPDEFSILKGINGLPIEFDDVSIIMGESVAFSKLLYTFLLASMFTLDGQVTLQEMYRKGEMKDGSDPAFLDPILGRGRFVTLKTWSQVFIDNYGQRLTGLIDTLVAVPPSVSYMREQLCSFSYRQTPNSYWDGHIQGATFSVQKGVSGCCKEPILSGYLQRPERESYFGFQYYELEPKFNPYGDDKWKRDLQQTLVNFYHTPLEHSIACGKVMYMPPSSAWTDRSFWKQVNPIIDLWDIRYGMPPNNYSLDMQFATTIHNYWHRREIAAARKAVVKKEEGDGSKRSRHDSDSDSEAEEKPPVKKPAYAQALGNKKGQQKQEGTSKKPQPPSQKPQTRRGDRGVPGQQRGQLGREKAKREIKNVPT